MNEQELQRYLNEKIPQSRSMEVTVEEIGEHSLTLSAPLEANINHRDSVFGGSASSVAILSAWAFLHTRMQRLNLSPTLVIQNNTMSYDHPILGRFQAVAALPEGARWERFLKTLERHGRARIEVQSKLYFNNKVAGVMTGNFVAVNPSH